MAKADAAVPAEQPAQDPAGAGYDPAELDPAALAKDRIEQLDRTEADNAARGHARPEQTEG